LYLHLLRDHTDLPSFPTRRSSDLEVDRGAVIGIQPRPSILGPAGKLDRGIDGLRPGSALALVLGSVPRPVADPEDHSVLVGPGAQRPCRAVDDDGGSVNRDLDHVVLLACRRRPLPTFRWPY